MVDLYRPTAFGTGGGSSVNAGKDNAKEGRRSNANATTHAPADGSTWIVNKDSQARLALLYDNLAKQQSREEGAAETVPQNTANSSAATDSGNSKLDQATEIVHQKLAEAANDKEAFHEIMRQAYGDSYNYEKAE